MKYTIGPITDLERIRAAVATLAGYPRRVDYGPGTADTYQGPNTHGWMDGVLDIVLEVGDGNGILRMPSPDVDPYLGQSTEVDGQTVTVPAAEELLEREQMPESYQQALHAFENPPIFLGV